jgi:hypothetical protein
MDIIQHGFVVVDSPRGNDATAERDSWSQPFATVGKAFESLRDYDTLLIYPGPYMETPQEPVNVLDLEAGGAALVLEDRRCVTIRGIGLPEIWFTSHGSGLAIKNCADIRVEGLKLRGAGLLTEPKPYYFALLLLDGVNEGITIRDCVFAESGNHGIGHLLGPRATNNSLIENNRFLTGGHLNHPVLSYDGAAIALGGSGNLIYGNRIERWLRGMEFESGSYPGLDTPTSRNIFSHNKVLQCWWQHVLVVPTHLQAALFDQLLIEGNIIQGWGAQPPQNFNANATFAHEGIYFGGGVNAQIRGNDISDMWDGIGLRMTADWCDIRDVLVSDNRIRNVDRTGIHAISMPKQGAVQRCRINSNKIGPCGGRGIWINGDYNVIESNGIHLCRGSQIWEGLYVEAGRRNVFRNNRLIDCLALLDKGTETRATENDQFWETLRAPRR